MPSAGQIIWPRFAGAHLNESHLFPMNGTNTTDNFYVIFHLVNENHEDERKAFKADLKRVVIHRVPELGLEFRANKLRPKLP